MPQRITEIQQLHFDLMEKSSFNEFDSQRVVLDLKANLELWLGAIMGDICQNDLIALRDLKDNCSNIANLYILCLKEQAEGLRELAKTWKPDEIRWLRNPQWKLGSWTPETKDYKILALWWD